MGGEGMEGNSARHNWYSSMDGNEKRTVWGSFVAWGFDAIDFFVMLFVMIYIARSFSVTVADIAATIIITLAMRFVGSFIFGPIGDRYGRKIAMELSLLLLGLFTFMAAFSFNYASFFAFRALYGLGMGGLWGAASSLAIENAPVKSRGPISGIVQNGYALGYLFAAVIFYFVFPAFNHALGWRIMFVIASILPILWIAYIHFGIKESNVYKNYQKKGKARLNQTGNAIRKNFWLFIFLIVLMTGENFTSHGTQDLYPTFLESGLGITTSVVAIIAIIYNIGAIIGGLSSGLISEKFGRLGRKWTAVIFLAAGLIVIPFWAYPQHLTIVSIAVSAAIAAFIMQFFVQGAWGMVPAYLDESTPAEARATMTGGAYMTGVMIASTSAYIEIALEML
ncbi:MAG: MFS transporter [Thermoplasmata archaeon]